MWEIGESAFSRCSMLSKVYIGYSVSKLGYQVFSTCDNLKEIFIKGYNPPTFNDLYFTQYDATIYVPKDCFDTYKNHSVWGKFSSMKEYPSISLRIDASVRELDHDYFYDFTEMISSVSIPCTVKKVKTSTFQGMHSLRKVIIEGDSDPLDFDEGHNFVGCLLDSVCVGRKMIRASMPINPFLDNRESLCYLSIGGEINEITDKAFIGFIGLKALNISDGLEKIGTQAFYGCEGLTSLAIPKSVKEIGTQAFDLCRNLKTLTFEDGAEKLMFAASENNLNNAFQNSPIEEIYLGRNLSFANSSPLSFMESLKTLTIGSEVTQLADKTFIGCPNLKDVLSYAKNVPSTGTTVFTPSYLPSATLHVPYELYSQYKVAPVWKDFGTIVNFEGLYKLIYMVDGEVYKETVYEYGAAITPEPHPGGDYQNFEWVDLPQTMPAHDVVVHANYTSGIIDVPIATQHNVRIYSPNGKKLDKLQKGLNIVISDDGTVHKTIIK